MSKGERREVLEIEEALKKYDSALRVFERKSKLPAKLPNGEANKEKLDYADAFLKYAEFFIHERKVKGMEEKCVKAGVECCLIARKLYAQLIHELTGGTVDDLDAYQFEIGQTYKIMEDYWRTFFLISYWDLKSYIYYLESLREPTKRFYQPREKTLNIVAKDLQNLENERYKFYGLSLPSRTGKSSLCIFFLSWVMMRKPNSHSAMGGHSGILAKGFHKEIGNIINTEEYRFEEMYYFWHPWCKRYNLPTSSSAEDLTITLGDHDRFATLTCRGVDGTWTGAVDVSWDGYLYVDDLVRDREHSLSPQRMENTFQEYLNKMVDRKSGHRGIADAWKGLCVDIEEDETSKSGYRVTITKASNNRQFAGAKELMVGTLWNVLDPLERMRNKYEGNPLYLFRRIPALNDNDESNFAYKVNGFSTEYFKEIRDRLDSAEWFAKYQQQPFVREGILFEPSELRYFNGILPDGEYKTVAVVDIAWGGGDSLSMPIGKQSIETGDVYIVDWVFNGGAKEVTIPLVVGQIINNEIRKVRFEGNQGGELYRQYVDEQLQKHKYRCNTEDVKAPNKVSKQEKIIAYSGDIKRKFVFLESRQPTQEELKLDVEIGIKRYRRSKEYDKAMSELCRYVTIGKNEHDDAPDGLTQLQMMIDGYGASKVVQIMSSPF